MPAAAMDRPAARLTGPRAAAAIGHVGSAGPEQQAFARHNPMTDRFELRRFHHVEFYTADATMTYKRCAVRAQPAAALCLEEDPAHRAPAAAPKCAGPRTASSPAIAFNVSRAAGYSTRWAWRSSPSQTSVRATPSRRATCCAAARSASSSRRRSARRRRTGARCRRCQALTPPPPLTLYAHTASPCAPSVRRCCLSGGLSLAPRCSVL